MKGRAFPLGSAKTTCWGSDIKRKEIKEVLGRKRVLIRQGGLFNSLGSGAL